MRQTSIQSYRTIKENGLLSRRRMEVYEILHNYGPGTSGELSTHTHVQTKNDFSSRLTELRNMGIAQELGTRRCTVTGKECIVWEIVDKLPTPRNSKHDWKLTKGFFRSLTSLGRLTQNPIESEAIKIVLEIAQRGQP